MNQTKGANILLIRFTDYTEYLIGSENVIVA